MYERILVPLDGSALAEEILPQVERLTHGTDPEIFIARAVDVPMEVSSRHDVMTALREQAQNYIQKKRRELLAKFKQVRGHVHDGDAAACIIDVAAETSCDLIAMTTHGFTGLSRWFFGSVAERVLRASKVPVLMMKSFEEPGRNDSPPAKAAIRRILVPLDGSKEAEEILPHARELSNRFDAEMTAYFVVHPETHGKQLGYFDGGAYLAQVVERLRSRGDRIVPAVGVGYPADQIVRFALENSMDLIAMTTHGRTGVGRWWLGSVAEKVIRNLGRPILLVRIKGQP